MELKNLKVINETLVEKILDQFENINIQDIYNTKFIDNINRLFKNYKILVEEDNSDPTINKISGSIHKVPNDVVDPEYKDFKYVIMIYRPQKELTKQDERDYVNTILHEFTHFIIVQLLNQLEDPNRKNTIIDKFNKILSTRTNKFNINVLTKDKAIKFLDYVFSIKERPVFALSIAYSCYHLREKETAQKLFDLNKKYILNFEKGRNISIQHMNNYIGSLHDEKLSLFEIQYAVYFLSDKKYYQKLESFMNLIKKYEKRFFSFSRKLGE